MKVLELFSGTQSVSKVFKARGHQTLCIEQNNIFKLSPYDLEQLTADVLDVKAKLILKIFGKPDVIWASPPCQTHSVAAISKHRQKCENGLLEAKSEDAKLHDLILLHTLKLIQELKPKFFFIENPRGGMRKSSLMQGVMFRHTITYCQYGDTRMKPTDIWTNHPNPNFNPPCKNGDSCHEKAPRGSRTGTQGLKGDIARSVIPPLFCEHLVNTCELSLNKRRKSRK